ILLSILIIGHLRPLCAFASKIVQQRTDIAITFFSCGDYNKKIQGEIDRYIPNNRAGSNIRWVQMQLVNVGGQGFDVFQLMPVIFNQFPDYFRRLVACESVQCQATGTTFPTIISPTAAAIDFFLLPVLLAIRAVTGKTVPVLAWDSSAAFATARLFGSEELGGLGDVAAKANLLTKATGREIGETIHELSNPTKGELVVLPGMPIQYDYEWFPQETRRSDAHIAGYKWVHRLTFSFNCQSDGIICTSSSAYEPEAIAVLRKWFASSGNRELYVIGPLVPPRRLSDSAKSFELEGSENGNECQLFMDKILGEHGDKSLIYISFGSMWWPKDEYLWIFVDVLLELRFPFIISVASPKANLITEVTQKVKESGTGFISKWAPQQTILNHPVTGWVLTHGGQNTIIETLAQGIPLIAWPISLDQPANAAYLTLTLDVAFELIQVRTGESGLRPLYRGVQATGTPDAVASEARHVLQSARGEEGKKKRRNAEVLRDNLRKAWEEDGEGMINLRRFLRDSSKKE
ncbi:UDP-Glycosyltransferase/glycogen phosphorylase, partial [Tricholoma matsutake]